MSLFIWTLILIGSATCLPLRPGSDMQVYIQNPSVAKFREYIRIDTSREENLPVAVEFWQREACSAGLSMTVYKPAGKPIVVITWPGADETLPSIMLNSHMDVVPVEEEEWSYPPFAAEIDYQGNIYGRGTQDDKDVSIQYLEAIRKLIHQNVKLQRTVHITLMPDEELGGLSGMAVWRDTAEFKALNVGFALDEGFAMPGDIMYAGFQDKRPWQMKITVHGNDGHGSNLTENSAQIKLQKLMTVIEQFRTQQTALMSTKGALDYGSYTSVNINVVGGGFATNVIPSKMYLVVDVRLATDVHPAEMERLVNSWLAVAGNGTTLEYIRRLDETVATHVDNSNPYWTAMQNAVKHLNISLIPLVIPATSDMIYLRSRGYQAISFAPKTNTISRFHAHDEYLNVKTFLRGIDVFVELLKELGNVKA